MKKIDLLVGKWNIKKKLNNRIIISGKLRLKKINHQNYNFFEETETCINNNLLNSFQNFKIFSNDKNIDFYFNTGVDKNKLYQSFNRKKKYSFYYCNKDVYLMKLNIFSNNFFNILTKISGPKKNIFIFANYYRTI